MVVASGTPLWPAGHLPLKGGDQSRPRPTQAIKAFAESVTCVISPLEGEMAGRPEGGATRKRLAPRASQ
jgi:hypothetical protein